MKVLNSCDIAKLSKEELALFGLIETFENVNIELINNQSTEVANEDCSSIEV